MNMVVAIAGPTASGKSALAMALADAIGCATIVNADASQTYRDLRILSARPSPADEARVPHRLFGVRDGAEPLSAAAWAGLAKAEIDAAHALGRVPVLVGGTGLYLRTLIEGIAPVPEIDPEIRETVRAMTLNDAHAALSAQDPVMASRLRPSDPARIMRALEVVRSTGRSLADWQVARDGGIAATHTVHGLVLLPPRDWLRARCDARFGAMLDAGAADEVAALLTRRLDPALPVMRAIGVPEIAAWLRGEIDRDTMIARATAATRQYAKRQTTWFRTQSPADWHCHMAQLDNKNDILEAIMFLERALTHKLASHIARPSPDTGHHRERP